MLQLEGRSMKKLPEVGDVLREAQELFQAQGQATTLEVKDRLRGKGFWAEQEPISAAMRDLAAHLGWTVRQTGTHREYRPADLDADLLDALLTRH
jgi:hypothetical protein